MINSRDIKDLTPETKILAERFLHECSKKGIDVIITSTYRDYESQNTLYAQGRTLPGKKVTNAKGGYSYHNFRVAFDFCPIVNGKAQWNNTALFTECGQIGESIGLEWAGRWKTFKELAHLQNAKGKSLAQLRSEHPSL